MPLLLCFGDAVITVVVHVRIQVIQKGYKCRISPRPASRQLPSMDKNDVIPMAKAPDIMFNM
jgi:hypothetical protein